MKRNSLVRKTLGILIVLLLIAGLYFTINSRTVPATSKLTVSTSFYPLYDFTKNVGGEYVEVTNVTPPGAEPHDYEPSPQVLSKVLRAKVLIYNDAHLEKWAVNLSKDHSGVVLEVGKSVDHSSSPSDPHYWLDPILATQMVTVIRNSLSKADPAHAAAFRDNANRYIASLRKLDGEFKAGLQSCTRRTIITSHDAFGYLARRYNFTLRSIAGLSPEEEPSAEKLASLSKIVRTEHIPYIFFESLVSPRLADTIARETNARTLVLDPIEGLSNAQQRQGKNYLTLQRQNLKNLRLALECDGTNDSAH